MNSVVAGGSGFVGRRLIQTLQQRGHAVVVLTRGSPTAVERLPSGVQAVTWAGAWVGEVQKADAVVNLAGASIGGGRWTENRKRLLFESRIGPTEAIVRALAAAKRPTALITASGIDYYGDHPGDEVLDEHAPAGSSFLAQLCVC